MEAQREILLMRGNLPTPDSLLIIRPRVFDLLDESDRIELLTRIMVRERFVAALEGRIICDETLLKLKDVFFRYAYPTPPPGWC